jgi:hypothetical protein
LPEPAPLPTPGSRTWTTIGAQGKDALLLRLLYDHGMVDVDGVIVE